MGKTVVYFNPWRMTRHLVRPSRGAKRNAMKTREFTTSDLVGLGLDYPGNYSNASGRGAITAADGEMLTITMEDGRRWKEHLQEFKRYLNCKIRPIYVLNKQFHGAPYLAQLEAAFQLAKFNSEAAAKIARDARTAEQSALVGKVRFMAYYVTDGTNKAKVNYSQGKLCNDPRDCVTLYAQEYGCQLSPIFGRSSENDTDTQVDYFDKDKVRIFDDSPLYPAALARAQANDAKREARYAKRYAR